MENPYLSDFPLCEGTIVTDLATDTTYNKDQLDRYANGIACGMLKLGLPANARIAVLGKVSVHFVAFALAMYRARITMLPVNFKIPVAQIEYCIDDSECELVFCDPDLRHLVPAKYRTIEFGSAEFNNILDYSEFSMPPYDGDKTAIIMYTSGTTGQPKGVELSFNSRIWAIAKGNKVEDMRPGIPHAGTIHVSPIYHLAGLNNIDMAIMHSTHQTNRLVLMPEFDARKYIEAIDKYQVTTVRVVAPMMSMILQEVDLLKKSRLDSVNLVVLTSAAAPIKLQNSVKEYFINAGEIENPYGLTETGPLFTTRHPLGIPRPPSSVGYPAIGTKARIIDGILQIKCPSMLTGYRKNDDLYKSKLTDDGYFVTGDLFRVNKYGFYFYMGRADDMFKSGAEKIYPHEIESVIDTCSDVALSCVVGLPDDIKGHKPYAFVQLKPGSTTTASEIKEHTIKNVATYQIPRRVWILDELPKTNIGKIDRRTLTALAQKLLDEEPAKPL